MKPTVGRIVHYWYGKSEPRAAIITAVHSDTCVNLTTFLADGGTEPQTSVVFIHDDDTHTDQPCCRWPKREESEVAQAARRGFRS